MRYWLVLGGIAMALAFPLQPHPAQPGIALWPLAWIALSPLLARLQTARTSWDAAKSAFLFAAVWFLIDCVWIFRVFDAFGWLLMGLPIAWVVTFGVLANWTFRRGLSIWWSWPALWIATEFVRSEWSPIRLDWFSASLDPLRFSWMVLGHSRVSDPMLAQTADIWGGYGLSLAPFLTNLLIADLTVRRKVRFAPALATIALLAAEAGYGYWSLLERTLETEIAVGVVQSERESMTALIELTESLIADHPEIRIVVWPEESFSEKLGDVSVLQAFAAQHNLTLISGVERPTENGRHDNIALVLWPNREIGIYHKRERVPFVEMHAKAIDVPTFPIVVDDRTIRAGVLICYDADFPTTARELARAGAEILLMPTLDEGGWGGTQHVQHAQLPRLRAIENRRPVVQAATSGVSQIIDDRGRVLAEIPYRLNRRPERPTLFREGTATAAIVPNAELSVYTRFGYWFGPVMVAGAGVAIALAIGRRKAAPI